MKILSLSDIPVQMIYSAQIRGLFPDVNLILACGDLPYYYQEFVVSMLDVPLYFVRGNHDKLVEYNLHGQRTAPQGGTNLHCRVMDHQGLLLAGVEGSLRYRSGPYQYSQSEMWFNTLTLVPGLLRNRFKYGRYLDVFVTHAPPKGIHDMNDLPHQGIEAFRWLLQVFKPSYHFHGHIHVYRPDTVTETRFENTLVINTFGYRTTTINGDRTASEPGF